MAYFNAKASRPIYWEAESRIRNKFILKAHALVLVLLMRRSKIELYISVLEALAYYGPMKLTRITYKARMNCSLLKIILNDLIKKKLVEEKMLKKNNVVFAATSKARTILFYFKELKEMLPLAE